MCLFCKRRVLWYKYLKRKGLCAHSPWDKKSATSFQTQHVRIIKKNIFSSAKVTKETFQFSFFYGAHWKRKFDRVFVCGRRSHEPKKMDVWMDKLLEIVTQSHAPNYKSLSSSVSQSRVVISNKTNPSENTVFSLYLCLHGFFLLPPPSSLWDLKCSWSGIIILYSFLLHREGCSQSTLCLLKCSSFNLSAVLNSYSLAHFPCLFRFFSRTSAVFFFYFLTLLSHTIVPRDWLVLSLFLLAFGQNCA